MTEAGKNPTVGFAGLSHLGICSAAAAAAKGFRVIGFDGDAELIGQLIAAQLPIHEPGLQELWEEQSDRLELNADPAILSECDLVYLSLDIPTDDGTGLSDLMPLKRLAELVQPHLNPEAILIVLSQVPPGFTRGLAQGQRNIFYQVETLVFGDAVERALHPERIIIGCHDPEIDLPATYRTFLQAFDCPLLPMAFESAEITKISINCMLTAAVSTSNMLAEICEKMGGDWDEVVPALRQDRRIGPHAYLKPGLGIAGGNLERDLATVASLAMESGSHAGMITAMQESSRYYRDWVLRHFKEEFHNPSPIALWGLAYKAGTASVKNAPSLDLISALKGTEIRVHDFEVGDLPEEGYRRCADPIDCLEDAWALVIMTPDSRYREVPVDQLASRMAGDLVLDPFGLLPEDKVRKAGLRYYRIGNDRDRRNGVTNDPA